MQQYDSKEHTGLERNRPTEEDCMRSSVQVKAQRQTDLSTDTKIQTYGQTLNYGRLQTLDNYTQIERHGQRKAQISRHSNRHREGQRQVRNKNVQQQRQREQ